MRLVCPSCGANYEIDAALLPDDGREVQCSACNFIWFQEHPAPQRVETALEQQPTRAQNSPPPAGPPQSQLREPEDEEADNTPADLAASTARTPSREVLEILREEAEYEARARARDADGLETQPDLGLMPSAPWPSKTQDTDAKPENQERPDNLSPSSSEAFPDIEDISKSLDPIESGAKRGATEFELPATAEESRRGFLRGLAIALALGAILVLLYTQAPQIVEMFPASEPVLTSYVLAIDALRLRLGTLLSG